MERDVVLRRVVLTTVVAVLACGRDPTQPESGGLLGDASMAKGTPGTYQLRFLDHRLQPITSLIAGSGAELILGAHVESASGVPATSGQVTFEYCSYRGLPPNDITRADEAPREACHNGTASWDRLLSLSVNASGNAFMNFGSVRFPRLVGFRIRYTAQQSLIASGISPDSDFVWVAPAALAVTGASPAAPSNMQVALVAPQEIHVAWQDNSTNETRFEVRRAFSGNVLLLTTGANVRSLSDPGLAFSTEHCYDVRAVRQVGQKLVYSTYSNTACVNTPAPPPPPPSPPPPPPPPVPPTAVTSVASQPAHSLRIQVTWTAENTGAASFRIERSPDGVGSWIPVGTAPAYGELRFLDNVSSETRYCYRVISVNTAGEAPPSNVSCTATPNATHLTGTLVNPETLVLSWPDNSNVEDGYEVWVYLFRASFYCYPPGSDIHDAGAIEFFGVAVRLPPNTTSWQTTPLIDTSCDPPTEYTLHVAATRDGGNSGYSNGISGSGAPVNFRRRINRP